MIKVTYIEFNGTERTVEVEEGVSLMEAAVTHLVPGSRACAAARAPCVNCAT